ncbi:hypothetical protein HW509_10800 [Asaia spathodeae]|uniref:hypothetical protein n=1 Tax=Asaia spathodeae TaxID=657016 RepID=UPI002FC3381B
MNRIYAKIAAVAASAVWLSTPSFAQTPVTVSSWGSPVTIVGGGQPNGPAMLDANGQIPTANLGQYLTRAQVAAQYLPLSGGTINGTLVVIGGNMVVQGGNSVLLTYSGTRTGAYFSTNSFGDLVINTAVGGGGGIRMIPTTFANLPSSPPAGTEHYCSDCYIGSGSKGVNVLYNGTAWTSTSGAAVSH